MRRSLRVHLTTVLATLAAACGDDGEAATDAAGDADAGEARDAPDAPSDIPEAGPDIAQDTMPAHADERWGQVSDYLVNGRTTVTVHAGDALDVTLTYRIWNAPDCADCPQQVMVGIDDGAEVGCAYDGVPGAYPGIRTEDASVLLHAPASIGAHMVRFEFVSKENCEAAKAYYRANPPAASQNLFEIGVE